ncbi:MAG TPA: hypothetical protein VKG21_12105 [Casimicrobiaceae bacterium]|nr:hypothetical protein [Casimicrobiaceae bacterium]
MNPALPPTDIADPRTFPETTDPVHAPLLDLAAASLAASSTVRASDIDRALVAALASLLKSGDGLLLSELLASAPSFAVARHLWRRLIEAWKEASRSVGSEQLTATLFAMPTVIVAAATSNDEIPLVDGILKDPEQVAALLREHQALGGNQNFVLSGAIVAADSIDVAHLPLLLDSQRRVLAGDGANLDLPPTPIAIQAGQEGVHLRFVMGHALTAAELDVLASSDTSGWGLPFAGELGRQLSIPGVSLLALPGAPQAPPAALMHGRAAQRAVGAQLFAGNAIRRLRGSVGEPAAVISAHRCSSAPGGGELRLSLSSVLDPREAQGFRCPLFPTDSVADVAAMLVDLLHDCRVSDVRVLPGVHGDRDPTTGLMLLFKADALPGAPPQTRLH